MATGGGGAHVREPLTGRSADAGLEIQELAPGEPTAREVKAFTDVCPANLRQRHIWAAAAGSVIKLCGKTKQTTKNKNPQQQVSVLKNTSSAVIWLPGGSGKSERLARKLAQSSHITLNPPPCAEY